MRVKLEWLNELVDLTGISIDELVQKISLYSIEIEGIDKIVDGTNLVIGHVLTKVPHPDSDHLNILTVDVKTEILQIVCGAPNVEVGQYVIVALIGAILPGDFKIKKAKVRGIESNGMVCSLQEIGMEKKFIPSKYEKGIYYFEDTDIDRDKLIGSDALAALNFKDEVIELGLTPNRADMMSMLGVAIEFSAVFDRPLKPLAYKLITTDLEVCSKIKVESTTEKCLSYYGAYCANIEINDSPRWLRSRLTAFGCRSINNVVDITNYVLALFGQPLHAFDADLLGEKILVRNAYDKETITTLDGIERVLSSSDLVITDGDKPVALAGVMGGLTTEVTNDTKNLVIEAAVFDPMTIRKTSTNFALRSESSIRYERGVDLNRTKTALDYACYLLKELCGATVYSNYVHTGIEKIEDKEILLTKEEVQNLLGIKITEDEIIDIFNKLGFSTNLSGNVMHVFVPNRRLDIEMKADLIEEVAKIYGYEKIPVTFPIDNMFGKLSLAQKNIRSLRHVLASLGLKQIVSYSLVSPEMNKKFEFNHLDNSQPIELLMPMSEDHKQMRMSLIPSLAEISKYNTARKVKDINLFELGRVYQNVDGENVENETLAILMSGQYSNTIWAGKEEKVDFFLLKGLLNQALSSINIELQYTPLSILCDELHPTRTALLSYNGQVIGFIGELHPKYASNMDLNETYVAELNLSKIINIKHEVVHYKQIVKTPSVERDLALVVDKSVLADNLLNVIKKTDKSITDVKVFDLYIGDKIPDSKKSLAVKIVLNSDETLTEEIINKKISKILKNLEKEFNANLRAS